MDAGGTMRWIAALVLGTMLAGCGQDISGSSGGSGGTSGTGGSGGTGGTGGRA